MRSSLLLSYLLSVALATPVPDTAESLIDRRAACATGVHIIVARGTTEFQGPGLQNVIIQGIQSAIPGSDFESVVYPASFDINNSLQAGVSNAQGLISNYSTACPGTKMVLMGYSQGAQVIGDAVAGGGTGTPFGSPSPPATPLASSVMSKVGAIVLFGDPNRVNSIGTQSAPTPCTVDAKTPRAGTNYAIISKYAGIIQEWCDKGDPVCCSSGNNFLALIGYYNSANAATAAAFVKSKVKA